MDIFHLSIKPIGRSAGRSATAASAYRAAVVIIDERTGVVHNYTRKSGVLHSEIILPGGGTTDRSAFWNSVEKHHKRGDAVLSREVEVSLPSILTGEERQKLAVGLARELSEKYGVAADVALHAPRFFTKKEIEKNPAQYMEIEADTGRLHNGNWHAHIMLSACHVSLAGELGKKAVELDPIHCKKAKIENIADRERPRWEQLVNNALARAGYAQRVDHRSLADQGIDREPTTHRGPTLSAIYRRGGHSHVAVERATKRLETAAMLASLEQQKETTVDQILAAAVDLSKLLFERDQLLAKPKTPEAKPKTFEEMRRISRAAHAPAAQIWTPDDDHQAPENPTEIYRP